MNSVYLKAHHILCLIVHNLHNIYESEMTACGWTSHLNPLPSVCCCESTTVLNCEPHCVSEH